jgi:hypothetical protein
VDRQTCEESNLFQSRIRVGSCLEKILGCVLLFGVVRSLFFFGLNEDRVNLTHRKARWILCCRSQELLLVEKSKKINLFRIYFKSFS